MRENFDEYLLDALIKQFGEADGRKMFDHHQYTHRHSKRGENVIHVMFEGDAFTDDDVALINNEFLKNNYQFSYVDESQVMKAHFDYQQIIATIYLSLPIVEILTNAIIYPAIWDSIKSVTGRIAKKRDELKYKVKKDTICISIEVKKDKTVKMLLNGDVKPEQINAFMDKALEFTKQVDINKKQDDGSSPWHYYSVSSTGDIEFLE